MPISLRLALRQWMARPLRPVLCSLAIAAAVALILCVGAMMDSLRLTMSLAIGQALGAAEAHVRPAQRGTSARVPQTILDRIRSFPEVEFAHGRLSSKAAVGEGDNHRWFDVVGFDPVLEERLRPKTCIEGRGLTGAMDEVLIDNVIAREMSLRVGDNLPFWVRDDAPRRSVRVVGITERPAIEIIARPTLFVPLAALEKDLGTTGEYTGVDVKLAVSAGIEDFDAYAKDLGTRLGNSVEVSPGVTSKARMGQITQSLRIMLILLSTISAICAALIIATTLSVGVQERIRQFGQLRCIGASRGQLATFLLGDALVLLVLGLTLGLLLGILLSWGLIAWLPNVFLVYRLTATSLIVAAFCAALATFGGALIPIWQVARVPPMAAVTAAGRPPQLAHVRLAAAVGAVCIALQIALWMIPQSRDIRVFGYAFLGIPLAFTGWCLLAPALVMTLESLAMRPLAILFGLRHNGASLLRGAWSRTPWRAGAMVAALMIGVTIFTSIRARGESIKNSWITPRLPDLVVKSILGGFNERRIQRLTREHPELRDFVPFDYFTVTMKGGADSHLGKMIREERATFVAVDPEAFTSQVEIDYVQGDATRALSALRRGRAVMVSTEFHNARNLGVGDTLTLRLADGTDAEFAIAAVVSSTGVDLVKSYFDLRASFGEKAVSSVLGTLDDARSDFRLADPTLMLMNVHDSMDSAGMLDLCKRLDSEGLASISSLELKETLTRIIDRIINGLSVIGLGALVVASLGVANMVIASIHARRYEFGVLRAIGAGRGQLVRLVLAEITLIGLVAGILGTAAGLWFAFMATQIDHVVIGFATSFISPHPSRALGVALLLCAAAIVLTTLLGWLASFVPALRGACAAQRILLAAGRG